MHALRSRASTFDELAHLPAGYVNLRFGDFRLTPDHTPLLREWAALPLLFSDVRFREDDEAWRLHRPWELGKRFLYRWNDADTLLFRARLPVVALGAALCAAVFLWTRLHFGPRAAALSLFLAVLSPELLAHGGLVTTDMGIALLVFLSVVAFERLTARLDAARLLLCGLAVGGAFAAKFSALVLLPVLSGLAAASVLLPEGLALPSGRATGRRERVVRLGLAFLAIAAIAVLVVWASYGFHSAISPDPEVAGSFSWERVSDVPAAVALAVEAARAAHLLPEAYLYGFLRFFHHSEARPSFAWGEHSETGFWWYFPLSFAIKTPLPLLALLALALAAAPRAPRRTALFLWLPVLVYLALTLSRNLNIGHRHLLPIYPFLFVAAGRAALLPGRRTRALVLGLSIWSGVAVARIHPHYLAYFNELVGPENGWRYLVDSNLDWGQDLKELGEWARSRGVRLKLSYFGTADPEYHRVPADLLPGYLVPAPARLVHEVRPGDLVAVSVTNLQEVYVPDEVKPLMRLLRERTPIATVGHSIRIYRADFAWP